MKRAMLSMAAACVLAVAIPTLADAQHRGGIGGGGGRIGGGSIGGGRIGGVGGGSFARSSPAGAFAAAPSGGQRIVQGGATVGGQRFVQGNVGGQRFVQGNVGGGRIARRDFDGRRFDGRRHFRRGFAVFGAPYYYDDGYNDYAYADSGSCYELRLIGGVWRQVWICDDNAY
jgi:hypothetical protein